MLKVKNRLKNNAAFTATYKQHQSYSDDLLILYVGKKKEKEEETIKIGFVVSKKISKLAVKRNQIKRYLREIIRLYLKLNPEPDFKSLIFMAKEGALDKNYKDFETSITNLLSKIK